MNEVSWTKKFVKLVLPPERWKFPVIILSGIIVGLGMNVLYISNAVSYLSDDPMACVNCHVMKPQYATWMHGSHGRDTNCNDCHVPHDNVFEKYWFKAQDGLRHATMFTLRMEPQVIQIKEAGKKAVQENCIRCHENSIQPVALRSINNNMIAEDGQRYCWDCHREVPHGRVNSLASTPFARVPRLKPVLPDWLNKHYNKK
ncbi:cytochrome c nitrite reductase small subunit [Bacteroidota bacterium]